VISTKQVFTAIKSSGISWEKSEKLIQELAWRDYWQQVWIVKGDEIHKDLKHPQFPVRNYKIPKAIATAQTGINAVDEAIQELYSSGYMHNHMRMYVATLCCNIARCHWRESAKWLYAHLLDGDLASNQLSWQWVSGANASKKYYANQNNINKYWGSNQKNTFLDVDEFIIMH
jgi:deoxyribodipyrimidine photo-lyase